MLRVFFSVETHPRNVKINHPHCGGNLTFSIFYEVVTTPNYITGCPIIKTPRVIKLSEKTLQKNYKSSTVRALSDDNITDGEAPESTTMTCVLISPATYGVFIV
jgi:hypothetical protein